MMPPEPGTIHGSRIVMSALADRLKTALPVRTASKCTYPSATVALSGIPASGTGADAVEPAAPAIPR